MSMRNIDAERVLFQDFKLFVMRWHGRHSQRSVIAAYLKDLERTGRTELRDYAIGKYEMTSAWYDELVAIVPEREMMQ